MTFNWQSYWDAEVTEHRAVSNRTFEAVAQDFEGMLNAAKTTIENGGTIFFFGNGGSAADAQHIATELTIRYKKDRAPIAAIALTTDTSALTAGGNDLGFDQIFARQLAALGRDGDLAIGLSTSGNSANVIEAFKVAGDKGIKTVAMTGETGGQLKAISDITIRVPSSTTARIQEMHITIGHLLCGALERTLGLVQD